MLKSTVTYADSWPATMKQMSVTLTDDTGEIVWRLRPISIAIRVFESPLLKEALPVLEKAIIAIAIQTYDEARRTN